ncbi:MAG TPA: ROK family protein, partial [Chitinophagaceae bacterium]
MAVIALDLGGTKLAAALFNDKGDILFKTNSSLDKKQGTEVGELIFLAANELLSKTNRVSAIGICVPGIAHSKTGKVWAPNIPGWDDYPLLDELQRSVKNVPKDSIGKKIKIKIDSDRACY